MNKKEIVGKIVQYDSSKTQYKVHVDDTNLPGSRSDWHKKYIKMRTEEGHSELAHMLTTQHPRHPAMIRYPTVDVAVIWCLFCNEELFVVL